MSFDKYSDQHTVRIGAATATSPAAAGDYLINTENDLILEANNNLTVRSDDTIVIQSGSGSANLTSNLANVVITANTTATMQSLSGNVNLLSVSGDIGFTASSGDILASSANLEITTSQVTSNVPIDCTDGDITIANGDMVINGDFIYSPLKTRHINLLGTKLKSQLSTVVTSDKTDGSGDPYLEIPFASQSNYFVLDLGEVLPHGVTIYRIRLDVEFEATTVGTRDISVDIFESTGFGASYNSVASVSKTGISTGRGTQSFTIPTISLNSESSTMYARFLPQWGVTGALNIYKIEIGYFVDTINI